MVYSSQGGIAVTGVGVYNAGIPNGFKVPLDFTARWDDEQLVNKPIGVLWQDPIDGRYGVPFHKAC